MVFTEPVLEVLWFIFLGLLGGVAYVIINSDSMDDLFTYASGKRYVIGIISGFLYQILYSQYDFPNSIMCFVSGYMGTTFIEGLTERLSNNKDSNN